MKIKYTGPKLEKRVTVGTKELIFNPYCELNPIFDIEIIKWLLHGDRAGLFVVAEVEDKTPSVEHPEATKVAAEVPKQAVLEAETGQSAPKSTKKGKDGAKPGKGKK